MEDERTRRLRLLDVTTELGPRSLLVDAASTHLTHREQEITAYVARGLTNPEIARALHLSPRTVEHHVSSILRKLEIPNRRALVLAGFS